MAEKKKVVRLDEGKVFSFFYSVIRKSDGKKFDSWLTASDSSKELRFDNASDAIGHAKAFALAAAVKLEAKFDFGYVEVIVGPPLNGVPIVTIAGNGDIAFSGDRKKAVERRHMAAEISAAMDTPTEEEAAKAAAEAAAKSESESDAKASEEGTI